MEQRPLAPITDAELDTLFRLAKALAMSGLFKDAKDASQALAKILVARDLGLSPTEGLMGIHIVEGKPELSANLQASFVKRAPGYDYRIVEHTDEVCEISYTHEGKEIGRSRFSMDDARRAGLANRGPWKSYPRNMLFARAMSNGVAFHCPGVTGGMRVYHEGEIDSTAVEIPAVPQIAASAELPVEVEDVLMRASRLGHDGYADRATAEMSILGQPRKFVLDWVARANKELNGMEPQDSGDSPEHIRRRAELLLDQAIVLREQGKSDEADELEDEGNRLLAEVNSGDD